MALNHSPKIVTDGLVFAYDMANTQKSWKGIPTTNACLIDGQSGVNPWSGDGTPTVLGIDPVVKFRGKSVAKFQTGTSGNCYLNGAGDLSTTNTSTAWTSTFYVKRVDGVPISSVSGYLYVTNNTNVNGACTLTQVEDGWYKAVYTRTGLVAGYPSLTGMYGFVAATQYYFAEWQCEPNSFSSPYVFGTRTNTQAIIDLTGQNTITANSLTYNVDGTFSFNGTNNGMTVPGTNFSLNTMTIEAWCYATNFQQSGFLFEKTTNGAVNTQYSLFFNGATTHLYYRTYGLSTGDLTLARSASGVVDGQWNHIVATFDGTYKKIYVNSVLKATSGALTGTVTQNTTGDAFIGIYGNFAGYPFNGKISNEKIYNRALTAVEVQQNFNALRGRYGI